MCHGRGYQGLKSRVYTCIFHLRKRVTNILLLVQFILQEGFHFLLPSSTTKPPTNLMDPQPIPPPNSTCYCGPTVDYYLLHNHLEYYGIYFGGVLSCILYIWLSTLVLHCLVRINKPWADFLAMAIARSCKQPIPKRQQDASAEAMENYVSSWDMSSVINYIFILR